jgi:hypothetical protein
MDNDIQFDFKYDNTESNTEQSMTNEKFNKIINKNILRFITLELPVKLFKYYDNKILKLTKLGFVSFNFQFQFNKELNTLKSIEFLKLYCKFRDLDLIYNYYKNDGTKGTFLKYDIIRAIVSLKKIDKNTV